MKLAIALLFLIFILQANVIAQEMDVLPGAKIELKGTIYDFYESEQVFEEKPLAYSMYLKSSRTKKASEVWGYSSLGSLLVGFALLTTTGHGDSCNLRTCVSTGQVIGALSILVVFPLTGSIAILSHLTYKSRLKKAANLFNTNRDIGLHQKQSMNLSFSLSQNGVGLVLNF